jgi:hypothetical protein
VPRTIGETPQVGIPGPEALIRDNGHHGSLCLHEKLKLEPAIYGHPFHDNYNILQCCLDKGFPRVTAFVSWVHICGPTTTALMGQTALI